MKSSSGEVGNKGSAPAMATGKAKSWLDHNSSIRPKSILCLIEDMFLIVSNQSLAQFIPHFEIISSDQGNDAALQHQRIMDHETPFRAD